MKNMNKTSESNQAQIKSARVHNYIRYALILLSLLGIGWLVFHIFNPNADSKTPADPSHPDQANSSSLQAPSIVVGVAQVRQDTVAHTVQALGTVTSSNTVVVMPQLDGILTQVEFEEGRLVHQGQVLAQIDDRAAQAELLKAQGQLLKDQALLDNANLDLQRYNALWKQNSIAKQQVDTQRSLVKQYQGVVKMDQAAVDNATLQLSYTQVTAPVDGRIGLRLVDVGNRVSPTDSKGIAQITQLKDVSVVFALPEQYLTQLMPLINQSKHDIVVQAWDRQNSHQLAEGKLLAMDSQVQTSTGSIQMKAGFKNAQQTLFPNQFVNVKMSLGTLPNAIIVPTVALQLGSAGHFVYLVNPSQQTVSAVKVTPGVVVGANTVIRSDALSPKDLVVIDGVDKLKQGAKIRVARTAPISSDLSPQQTDLNRVQSFRPPTAAGKQSQEQR